MHEEALAGFADALIARVAALHPGMTLLPGTASASTTADDGRDVLTVTMDNAVDVSIPASSLIGPIRAGDRVMVAFVPPQGAFVTNWATLPARFREWADYTPTLTQLGAVPFTTAYCRWKETEGVIHAAGVLNVTGAGGTAANGVFVSLPVAPAFTANSIIGQGQIYDASAAVPYGALAYSAVAGCGFGPTSQDVGGFLGAAVFVAALAAGDAVTFNVSYEPA